MQWKRGQATIFIIVAIVIVGLVIAFVAFRDRLGIGGIPSELQPVFSQYESCLGEETRIAIELLGVQGGRIDAGNYVSGSEYAPFSSHLVFLGNPIPFWYYVSGNGLIEENVPSRYDMEQEMNGFISERINACDFSPFYAQGFSIEMQRPSVKTTIRDDGVDVDVNEAVTVSRGETEATKRNHRVTIESRLGKLHSEALSIYNKEKTEAFLEHYSADVLRSYAPVDGVQVQCSPKIWKTQEVVDELKEALAENIGQVKFEGNYYNLKNSDENYFVVNTSVGGEARVLYSSDWASKVEISGDGVSQELMVAQPLGNQQGLETMGFCYVPYHFVYDVSFPALVQLGYGRELFQFPLVVVIEKNQPRNPLVAIVESQDESDVCAFKNGRAKISTYDAHLNPLLGARISYQCFEQTCELGETRIVDGNAVLDADVPVCVNGYLIAEADNYTAVKQLYSSNSETSAELVLDKLYPVKVNVKVDGKPLEGSAIVHFVSESGTISAVLPEQDSIMLNEGLYNVSVYVYGNSSVVIPESTRTECTQTTKGGLLGIFGGTKEQCFEINIPETRIDYALRGGGHGETYVFESDLEAGGATVFVQSLPLPESLEQLQYNFEIFQSLGVETSFP